MLTERVRHNPAFLSHEDLQRQFVVRTAERAMILQVIAANTGPANQHLLVIAPRGMGKTMLVRSVAISVTEDAELARSWLPVLVAEEKYAVATAGEFWLEILAHIHELPVSDSRRWREAYDRLRMEPDPARLRAQALARLRELADQEGCRLLVVVENLDMIFAQQAGDGLGWDLRETLLNEPRIMLLATATSSFAEIERPSRALYDLMREIRLTPLSTKDCGILWRHVTGQDLEGHSSRPVEILTGGNPRLVGILARFAASRSFRQFTDDFLALIDEYTPYFKALIEALPPVERRVLVTLAEIWDPCGARDVASHCRLGVSKTSALLNRLVQRGAAIRVASKGRKNLYQVADRLINIYYLVRQSQSQEDRVRALVEFMVRFYGAEEVRGLGRSEEALESYGEVVQRYGEREEPELTGLVTVALAWNAILLAKTNQRKESLESLAIALRKPMPPDQWMSVVQVTIELAARGEEHAVLKIIRDSQAAPQLEPLIVALQELAGETYTAPQEVAAVAKDIVERVRRRQKELQAKTKEEDPR